jgi:HTH-type transcriptional regulator / antitoxin HigA
MEHKSPGQLISSLLTERGWTQRVLALVLKMDETGVNKLVGDKRSMDANLALALEEVFHVHAERFLELQSSFDLAKARITHRPDVGRANRALLYGDLPVAEMIKRGWISADSIKDTETVENELIRFFGVNRVEDIEILPHSAKKTAVNDSPSPAQLAWLYRVRQIAKDMLARPYVRHSLSSALPKLRALAVSAEGTANVPRILAECGVRFVIVETLSSAKIDGACLWMNERSPVIGMTTRFDRIDNFWFVLRHEIEHVLREHGRDSIRLDANLEGDRAGIGPDIEEEERQANSAAQEFLISSSQLEAFVSRKAPFFSERDIIGFAKLMKIHPGILAGQLQRKTGRYDRFRDHLVSIREKILPNAFTDGWGNVAPID